MCWLRGELSAPAFCSSQRTVLADRSKSSPANFCTTPFAIRHLPFAAHKRPQKQLGKSLATIFLSLPLIRLHVVSQVAILTSLCFSAAVLFPFCQPTFSSQLLRAQQNGQKREEKRKKTPLSPRLNNNPKLSSPKHLD